MKAHTDDYNVGFVPDYNQRERTSLIPSCLKNFPDSL